MKWYQIRVKSAPRWVWVRSDGRKRTLLSWLCWHSKLKLLCCKTLDAVAKEEDTVGRWVTVKHKCYIRWPRASLTNASKKMLIIGHSGYNICKSGLPKTILFQRHIKWATPIKPLVNNLLNELKCILPCSMNKYRYVLIMFIWLQWKMCCNCTDLRRKPSHAEHFEIKQL